MKSLPKTIRPRELRRKLGISQLDFWAKVGVTQSGGSRYESGRGMPRPVQALVRLVHVEQLDLDAVKKEDIQLVDYLKSAKPALYKSLKKVAQSQPAAKKSGARH